MKAKYKYLMDYISDPQLFKAVMFARDMRRQGRSPSVAVRIAANYYDVDMKDVAHYMGQAGGRKSNERAQRKLKRKLSEN